jgi:hypothetical protein
MRFLRARLPVVFFALTALALPAIGSPAMPRPLEKVIWDADLVVVAHIDAPPEERGADFEFSIVEVLKGEAGEGPHRASSHVYFSGCMPPPEGSPPLPATEARGERMLLFLSKAQHGVRTSRDPIVLAVPEGASAWFYHGHAAALAPEAVRTLARLSDVDCERGATVVWKEGLRSGNPLLASALLHRVEFAASAADWYLGDDLTKIAVQQFEVARPHLLPIVAELSESENAALRHLSLSAARACLPPLDEAERVAQLRCADAAVVSSGTHKGHARVEGLRFLVDFGDQRAPEQLFGVLESIAAEDRQEIAMIGRDLVRQHPALGDVLMARLVAGMDKPWTVAALRSVSGDDTLTSADACRIWWDARSR